MQGPSERRDGPSFWNVSFQLCCISLFLAAVGLFVSKNLVAAPDPNNVLLDFTATWCGPCQTMSGVVSRLEREGLPIRKVDVDHEKHLAIRYRVESIPCFVLVANGREVQRIQGVTSEQELRKLMKLLPKAGPEALAGTGRNGKSSGANTVTEPQLGRPVPITPAPEGKRPLTPFLSQQGNRRSGSKTTAPTANSEEGLIARGQNPADGVPAGDPMVSSVRLRVNDETGVNFGSGTIIESQPGRTVILTCGHIFRKLGSASKLDVDFFPIDPRQKHESFPGKVLLFDKDADVGLVTVAHPQRLPHVKLANCLAIPSVKSRVFSIGCGNGDKPKREESVLTALNRYEGPDTIECTGVPELGRSGGGLFRGSELVGVCIAADPKDKRGIYCGLKPVAHLLEKVGMGHLLALPASSEGELAATAAPATGTKTASTSSSDGLAADTSVNGNVRADDELARLIAGEMNGTAFGDAPPAPRDYKGAEIVCIVRSKTPGVPSRIVIVNQATDRFVGDLLHETNDRPKTTVTQHVPAVRRPIRTDASSVTSGRELDQAVVATAPAVTRPAVGKGTASDTETRAEPLAVPGRPIETSFTPEPYVRRRNK